MKKRDETEEKPPELLGKSAAVLAEIVKLLDALPVAERRRIINTLCAYYEVYP